MGPFWVPIIVRHLIFRVPKKGTMILTTHPYIHTHVDHALIAKTPGGRGGLKLLHQQGQLLGLWLLKEPWGIVRGYFGDTLGNYYIIGLYRDYMGIIWELCGDNGKENGNYYLGFRVPLSRQNNGRDTWGHVSKSVEGWIKGSRVLRV